MERSAGRAQGVARAVLTPVFRALWRVTTEGLGNVPTSGGAIIAPNHISVLDSFFVPLTLPRRITYVGKAEYMDDWKTKYVFPAIGMIPIDRSGGDGAQRALDAAAEILEAGELFGIYPEGTRARDGKLHKGHTGIARLALRTGVPIVPVGIIGSEECQRPDAKLPSPFKRVHLRFGRPIDVTRYSDRADDRIVLRQITDEVMFEIANLSGQEYVDTYATKGAAMKVAPEAPESAAPGRSEPTADVPVLDGVPQEAEVIQFPDRRSERSDPRHPATMDTPAAGYAPSAALPTRERAASLALVVSDADADGVERRSSASVLRPRPLVGV
jgi:1-acyl-sn-glycerol-3-phosphate acyltransferase